jgi:excisionase family DNA binding protein
MSSEFMTVAEIAKLLGCSDRHVDQLIREGKIPSIRLSRKLRRMPRAAVLAALGLTTTA